MQHRLLGLLTGVGRLAEVQIAIQKTVAIGPENLPFRVREAEIHICLSQPGEAVAALERAVAAHPSQDYLRGLLEQAMTAARTATDIRA